MDSFYIYRKPNEEIFHGALGNVEKGYHKGRFIISSFYGRKDEILSITAEKEISLETIPESPVYNEIFPMPGQTTSKAEHCDVVSEFIHSLKNGEKAVACRVICGNRPLALKDSLLKLSQVFKNAFIFCFHTPQSGTWIGASPELLLSSHHEILKTFALAGTRPAGTTEPWDDKNLKEQRLVCDYISETLSKTGFKFSSTPDPVSHSIGKIEHLLSVFTVCAKPDSAFRSNMKLALQLSPTPALCGLPKDKGYNLIEKYENFSRGYYGGFCGFVEDNGDFDFYVILRALRLNNKGWAMYAGGGITPQSHPVMEWEETERKANSILKNIIFI